MKRRLVQNGIVAGRVAAGGVLTGLASFASFLIGWQDGEQVARCEGEHSEALREATVGRAPGCAVLLDDPTVGGLVLVVYKVFYANYRDRGAVPSLNMLVPFIALYVWWMPQTRQYEFYFLLTPLFHSLQYLAFVYKMEDTPAQIGKMVRATFTGTGTVPSNLPAIRALAEIYQRGRLIVGVDQNTYGFAFRDTDGRVSDRSALLMLGIR